jgi:hypothetical protein
MAFAQDRDHDRDDKDHDRDQAKAERSERAEKWRNRNGWEYNQYDRDRRPNGWNQGTVTDSRNCLDRDGDRRVQCYTYQYQGQPYYYYQDNNGRMYVRRHHHNDGDHVREDRDRGHDKVRDHDTDHH